LRSTLWSFVVTSLVLARSLQLPIIYPYHLGEGG
jgi:hypothetical protein